MTESALDDPRINLDESGAEAQRPAGPPPWWRSPFIADYIRPFAVAAWAAAFLCLMLIDGIPTEREQLIVWFAVGALAGTLGARNPLWVLVDWLPFALFLILYDYSRGAADTLGMPIHWRPQLEMDRFLFGGNVPTTWLQAHLKHREVQWWEAGVALTYTSHFIVPYAMCAWYWFRDRVLFLRFAGRFIALSFTGLAGYVLFPAAPPWAASRCRASDIAADEAVPTCIGYVFPPQDALIGHFTADNSALPFLQRVTLRGYDVLNMKFAGHWLEKGQATVNYFAAIPSLHGAFSVLILIFCWNRVRWWWRPVLVAYPLMMMFTLVWSGEHYVTDVLLGWMCAATVCAVASALETRRARRAGAASIGRPTDRQPDGETPCPQTAMTSSST